jgi:hypothetical protein
MTKLFAAAAAALCVAGTAQASWVVAILALASLGAALRVQRPQPVRAIA